MVTARRLVTAAAIVAAVAVAVPACASQGARFGYPIGGRQADDRAYTYGYNEGRDEGERDGQRGRRFDYARHDEFRDADRGYRGNGSRTRYRELFRQGFIEGYDDGYRGHARRGSVRPRGPYADRRGSSGGIYDRRGGRYESPAVQNGFRDGFEQGRKDARDGDRFDPVRASRYRSGDHDYNSRYGSRDDYKREYRDGSRQGYDRGYRENRR